MYAASEDRLPMLRTNHTEKALAPDTIVTDSPGGRIINDRLQKPNRANISNTGYYQTTVRKTMNKLVTLMFSYTDSFLWVTEVSFLMAMLYTMLQPN